MKRFVVLFALLLMVAIIIPTSAQTMRYKMIDPGGAGTKDYWFADINDSGQAIGFKKIGKYTRDIMWDPVNGEREMSTLAPGFSAKFISDTGQAAGSYWDSDTGEQYACVWDEHVGLTRFTHVPEGYWCQVEAMNDQGLVLLCTGIEDHLSAFLIWDTTSDTVVEMPTVPSWSSMWASAVNNSGKVAGVAHIDDGSQYGRDVSYVWDAQNGYIELSGMHSGICDLNDLGYVCGYVRQDTWVYSAVVWDNEGNMNQIPTCSTRDAFAVSINNCDQVAGKVSVGLGTYSARLWQNGQEYDLNLITDMAPGWTLTSAYKITDSGYILAHSSYNGTSARVILAPVPEPSAILALVSGLSGLGLVALKRRQAAG